MQSRDKLSSTDKLKLGNSNVRLRSIGQFFFFFLWVWFSSIVFTIELNRFIKFDWIRLMSITESSFRYIRFLSNLVSTYWCCPTLVSLSHFRLCSHYLSQVGSMYNGDEYYFDSTLVWNCVGISFNWFLVNVEWKCDFKLVFSVVAVVVTNCFTGQVKSLKVPNFSGVWGYFFTS